MNPVLTASSKSTSAPAATFHEKLVMAAFRPFVHGGLRMIWPNGYERVLGNPEEEVTAEVQIHSPQFFKRCALYGNVGLGESYVEGEWDTPNIAAVIVWFIQNLAATQGSGNSSGKVAFVNLLRGINRAQHLLRPNSLKTSRRNIAEHYDLGNEFYAQWLDATMTYSSARFDHHGQSLEDAQAAKYEALCQHLRLQASDHVLEIGCGWGGFCGYAAKRYGCRITAVTISEAQQKYAMKRVAGAGLAERVEIRLQDYRQVTGTFDKIVSIEMLEAVGDRYWPVYFKKCAELLKPQGLLALQMITVADCQHRDLRKGVDWIQKHIFPGSLLLSVGRVNEVINRTSDLFLHALDDMGASYAHTLQRWHERFNARWDVIQEQGFDERFRRKWNYYLQYCEAAFAMRNISVVQVVYTRPNNATLHQTFQP